MTPETFWENFLLAGSIVILLHCIVCWVV